MFTTRLAFSWFRERLDAPDGLSLLELTVVAAILGVLAAMVAVAVTGQATESRSTAQLADVSEVQKSVDAYAGQHPHGRYPTLNGCLPGAVLDLVTSRCVAPGLVTDPAQVDATNLEFVVSESTVGMDLSGDVDTNDLGTVAPLLWAKAFRGTDQSIKRFSGGFVQRSPKHAFAFLSGTDPDGGWRTGRQPDADGLGDIDADDLGNSLTITAPAGIGSGDDQIDASTLQVPVWVIDGRGAVYNLLPAGRY